MKKTFKRFMAFVMTGVLLASPMSSMVANATAGTPAATGDSPTKGEAVASGELEGFVKTDVFQVVLPTSVDESAFKFILDPQGLINETDHAKYASGDTFASGDTVYFETASGNYTNTSKAVQVINKGTVAVNVEVKATVTPATGVTMATGNAFADESASLYLALVEASGDGVAKEGGAVDVVDATDGATLTTTLASADASYYEFTYDGAYDYELKDEYATADASAFPNYSFALTGACNSEADWTDLTAPSVNIVWTLTNANGPTTPTFAKSENVVINYTGTVPTASNTVVTTPSGKTVTPTANAFTNGKIVVDKTASTVTFNTAWTSSYCTETGTYKVTVGGSSGTEYSFILQ